MLPFIVRNYKSSLEAYGMHWRKHEYQRCQKQMCVPLENRTYFGDENRVDPNPLFIYITYMTSETASIKMTGCSC